MYDFYVGVDVGVTYDFAAIAVIEAAVWCSAKWSPHQALPDGWVWPSDYDPKARDYLRSMEFHRGGMPSRPPMQVRHLQRIPAGSSNPQIVDAVVTLLGRAPLNHGTVLLVEANSIGGPTIDYLRLRGLQPVAVTVQGGQNVNTPTPDSLTVPKRDVVMAAVIALETGRLIIQPQIPDSVALVRELKDFKMNVSKKGHDTYGAQHASVHDDLVVAMSLCCWYRDWYSNNLDAANIAKPKISA